jgi:hypothetical protein
LGTGYPLNRKGIQNPAFKIKNFPPSRGPPGVSSTGEEFDDGGGGGSLTDPEEKHPLDDFGLGSLDFDFQISADLGSILFGHEAFGEIVFLFAEGDFEALGDGPGLRRLDVGRFENTQNFRRAHKGNVPDAVRWVKPSRCNRHPAQPRAHKNQNPVRWTIPPEGGTPNESPSRFIPPIHPAEALAEAEALAKADFSAIQSGENRRIALIAPAIFAGLPPAGCLRPSRSSGSKGAPRVRPHRPPVGHPVNDHAPRHLVLPQ